MELSIRELQFLKNITGNLFGQLSLGLKLYFKNYSK